jgi:hypothetical protein
VVEEQKGRLGLDNIDGLTELETLGLKRGASGVHENVEVASLFRNRAMRRILSPQWAKEMMAGPISIVIGKMNLGNRNDKNKVLRIC